MSFRLFVYYCSLVGAWMGIAGWAVGHMVAGRFASPDSLILQDGLRGMSLGALVSLGLGLVDAFWNVGRRMSLEFLARTILSVAIGGVGGFIGGAAAQWLVSMFGNSLPILPFSVLGWTVAGLLIGAALAAFEWLTCRMRARGEVEAKSKLLKCTIGGGLGGLFGDLAAHYLREGWLELFQGKDALQLWSPTAAGFATLGLFIGLLVGLTQVVLKKAWVRVESGFRPGREILLSHAVTRLGRAEDVEIPLFGDSGVEKAHAQIVREGIRYVVEDAGSSGGTFVNDKRVKGRTSLHPGDVIRIGRSSLRFFDVARGAAPRSRPLAR